MLRLLPRYSLMSGNELNRYAYVNNNPLKYVDPTGHAQACPDNNCGTPGTWTPPPRSVPSDLFFVCKQEKPHIDDIDLLLDKMVLGLDIIASGGTAFGAGIEIGGCLFGPEGCGTGFALYNAGLNQFETNLGYVSMLFTLGADVKRNNTCIDPQHLGIEIGPDSVLAVASNIIGSLVPEPAIDTVINVHSVANDINNLTVDEAAIQGIYATPSIPVLKPQGPILIRPVDWLLGPLAKIIYSQ